MQTSIAVMVAVIFVVGGYGGYADAAPCQKVPVQNYPDDPWGRHAAVADAERFERMYQNCLEHQEMTNAGAVAFMVAALMFAGMLIILAVIYVVVRRRRRRSNPQ